MLVFFSGFGKNSAEHIIRRLREGLGWTDEPKYFRWHDMRHTFASRLVQSGVPLYVVQKLLGHPSITMTERYSHLHPHNYKDAISNLEL